LLEDDLKSSQENILRKEEIFPRICEERSKFWLEEDELNYDPFTHIQKTRRIRKLMKEIRRMKVSDKDSKKEKVSYVLCRIARKIGYYEKC